MSLFSLLRLPSAASLGLLMCFAVGPASAQEPTAEVESEATAPAQAKPKVIFFDVNETLLDLASMRESVAGALGGREDLLPLWFSAMLHYSLVANEIGDYHDFGDIGVAALLMVAESNGIELREDEARNAIVPALRSLPPHPDVEPALQALRDQGFTLVSLTNSSNQGVTTQFENAGLTDYFERRLSIEDIEIYKPAGAAYAWALEQMGIEASEGMLVAAHGWDVAGAKAAGMEAVFIERPGKVLYPLGPQPDRSLRDLNALVEVLAE